MPDHLDKSLQSKLLFITAAGGDDVFEMLSSWQRLVLIIYQQNF